MPVEAQWQLQEDRGEINPRAKEYMTSEEVEAGQIVRDMTAG